jgi:LPPG:FO 2-phospho-L-lactate transferase
VGDQDLATHVYRTTRLSAGIPLDQVTTELADRLGVRARLLPMSNQPVTTRLLTDRGDSHFQEYFVRDRYQPAVYEIYWTGLEAARPAPGIAAAVAAARAIVIAPSNPIISIGPILRVPGMRDLLATARARCVAVSPVIAGRAVKGPTVELMRVEGLEPTALAVAELYRELASAFVLDAADTALSPAISRLGYRVAALPTLLDDRRAAETVAATALSLVDEKAAA